MDINVTHLAALAKLRLTKEEETMLAKDLPSILTYISKLQEVDTSGVDAKAYLTDATNVFRADEACPVAPEARKVLIDAFPEKTGDALRVPAVFD